MIKSVVTSQVVLISLFGKIVSFRESPTNLMPIGGKKTVGGDRSMKRLRSPIDHSGGLISTHRCILVSL